MQSRFASCPDRAHARHIPPLLLPASWDTCPLAAPRGGHARHPRAVHVSHAVRRELDCGKKISRTPPLWDPFRPMPRRPLPPHASWLRRANGSSRFHVCFNRRRHRGGPPRLAPVAADGEWLRHRGGPNASAAGPSLLGPASPSNKKGLTQLDWPWKLTPRQACATAATHSSPFASAPLLCGLPHHPNAAGGRGRPRPTALLRCPCIDARRAGPTFVFPSGYSARSPAPFSNVARVASVQGGDNVQATPVRASTALNWAMPSPLRWMTHPPAPGGTHAPVSALLNIGRCGRRQCCPRTLLLVPAARQGGPWIPQIRCCASLQPPTSGERPCVGPHREASVAPGAAPGRCR